MLKLALPVIVTVLLAAPILAEDEPRAAIEQTITSQIEAFLADDFETAFQFASPGIKRIFGDSDRFGLMVRNGYPMVWRPADVQYLDLDPIGGYYSQKVLITDAGGNMHLLEYQMIETADGWQINGVRILEVPRVGA